MVSVAGINVNPLKPVISYNLCHIIYTHYFFMVHTLLLVTRNISSRLSSNSEAFASELLENIEEMFLRYYYKHVFNGSQFSTTHYDVNRLNLYIVSTNIRMKHI